MTVIGDWKDEETTSTGKLRAIKRASQAEVPQDDVHLLLGKLMTSVARIEARQAELASLPREMASLRRDVELDREDLVRTSSRKAATHSSNRLAIIMGGLFSLYEVSSPYVHEIWKAMHQ